MEKAMKFMKYYTVLGSREEKKMFLNPCYVVVDKDGDFVDACSGRLPPHTLSSVVDRMTNQHPENIPFRILYWSGNNFVEVVPVS